MAFTYGFYNYDPNDDPADQKLYDAETISDLFDGLITDGVYGHVVDHFMVSANASGADDSVTVGSGRAWFNHTWNYNNASIRVVAPDAPSAGYKRIDALVIKVDRNTRKNEITWHSGTVTTGTPSRPTLTKEGGIYEYALAYVTRNGSSEITNVYITNAVGTPETPYVTGILETLDTTQLISTFESEYSRWIIEKQNEISTWFLVEQAEIMDWFDGIRDQLSEEAAIQLQLEINSLELRRSGTASSTGISKQHLMLNGESIGEVSGSAYMQQTQTLSTSADTTYTFTNNEITSDTDVSVSTNMNMNYKDISIDGNLHTCEVTFAPYTSATDMTVRLYLRNDASSPLPSAVLATASLPSITGDGMGFVNERDEYLTWLGDDISGIDCQYLNILVNNSTVIEFTPNSPYNSQTEYTLYSNGNDYLKISGIAPNANSVHIKWSIADSSVTLTVQLKASNQPIS